MATHSPCSTHSPASLSPERVNTGLLGLQSEMIDWGRMEHWCRTLIEQHGPHYYQEQALVALLLAGRPHIAAPRRIMSSLPEPPKRSIAGRSYTTMSPYSKRWYFQQNWRRVLAVNAPSHARRLPPLERLARLVMIATLLLPLAIAAAHRCFAPPVISHDTAIGLKIWSDMERGGRWR